MAIITGTAGNDTITNSVSSFGPLTTSGNDSVLGEGGNDSIQGGSGLDTLRGGAGIDTLLGGNDNDILAGDAGDDLLFGQAGNDLIDGGSGFDIISFFATSSDGAVSVAISAVGGVNGGTSTAGPLVLNQGNDTFVNIEQVNGSNANDTITVNSADTSTFTFLVRGNAGNDLLVNNNPTRNTSIFLDYRSTAVTAGVSVDLAAGRASDGLGGIDTISGFAGLRGTDRNDTLLGSADADRFRARAGSDFIDGRAGFDIADYGQAPGAVSINLATGRVQDGEGGIDTLAGIEEVWGTTGNDTMVGSGADEFFYGFNGNDTIDGGSGQDRVGFQFSSGLVPAGTRGVVVDLVAGTALDAWGGTDRLIGIERVIGTAFADSMLGGAESNRFRGRAGNDTLNGGLGGDFAEYTNATSGATVNLATGIATDGEGGTDLLISIENVIGSNFADRLTGVAQGARSTSDLRGGGGNDTLVGIAGEFVRADYADQTVGLSINLSTGTANDGRGGVDTLINIRGVVLFGDFADTVVGTAAAEWFGPSGGADSVNAGLGFDIIGYGGVDTGGVSVNLATARARDTGGAIDTIIGFEGVSTSFGDDTITGTAAGNLIGPATGADLVNAGLGDDTLSYVLGFSPDGVQFTANEAGDRLPVQGVTIDLLTGRATDYGGDIDTILGFENAIGSTAGDIVRGSGVANRLGGAEGNDTLEGRAGDDTLDGGAGIDRLVGGADDDTYILDATADVVFELAGQGIDTILTARATLVLGLNLENATATSATAHAFTGNGLANALTGNIGADTLNGAQGNDTLDGGAGIDRLLGGVGDDTFIVTAGDVVVEGLNQGTDTVFVTTGAAATLGLHLENLVLAGAGVLNGTGNGLANTIIGNDGANLLQGLGGDDVLDGGIGNDVLVGGLNSDSMTGGAGGDQFRFGSVNDSLASDADVILDFTFSAALGIDRIDLRLIDANSGVALNQAFSWIGGAAFGGTGAASAGQLRFEVITPGNYYAIEGDTDGDGIREFSINVISSFAPQAAWVFV
jgi:Ca2+-binding RTX toxin-like protein